jgi:MoaA/NifB/PqqE/SkfB family radical SAM enzyme
MAIWKREARIFIAGSEDVRAERQAIGEAILHWNEDSKRSDSIAWVLRAVRWERVPVPPNRPPQDSINHELDRCDLLVAVLGRRLGTNTALEIDRFLPTERPLLLYKSRRTGREVEKFVAECGNKNILAKPYDSVTDLKETFARDLDDNLGHGAYAIRERRIVAYSGSEDDAPRQYFTKETIQSLRPGDHLLVVGRTCHRWLIPIAGIEETIRQALAEGVEITFVVQDLWTNLLTAGLGVTIPMLIEHLNEAVDSYRKIKAGLSPGVAERFNLKYSPRLIRNSRVIVDRVPHGSNPEFRQDIGMEFSPKPYMVITDPALARQQIADTQYLVRTALSEEEFDWLAHSRKRETEKILIRGIIGAQKTSNFNSHLRHHGPGRLVRQTARWVIANSPPAPLSVQILLTQKCSTSCSMCSYYGRAKSETLKTEDLFSLLSDIRAMGSRSVIISGGEPLVHDKFVELLAHANKIGLKVGILTSGIMHPARNSDVEIDKVCDAIARYSSWVQISMDSFSREEFANIRRGGELNACASFVRKLKEERKFSAIEVCCTIQRGNVRQLIDQGLASHLAQIIPQGVPVRFKFAHSVWTDSAETPDPRDKAFLLSEDELRELRQSWAEGSGFGARTETNRTYVLQNLTQPAISDLAKGLPARRLLATLENRPCQAIKHTLFIDCNGDIYPCCYLFNDNASDWRPREDFRIASWKEEYDQGGPDALTRIWRCQRYKEVREKMLPVHPIACGRCTRHMHQNVFLNEVEESFVRYLNDGGNLIRLEQLLEETDDPADDRWEPTWL